MKWHIEKSFIQPARWFAYCMAANKAHYFLTWQDAMDYVIKETS